MQLSSMRSLVAHPAALGSARLGQASGVNKGLAVVIHISHLVAIAADVMMVIAGSSVQLCAPMTRRASCCGACWLHTRRPSGVAMVGQRLRGLARDGKGDAAVLLRTTLPLSAYPEALGAAVVSVSCLLVLGGEF